MFVIIRIPSYSPDESHSLSDRQHHLLHPGVVLHVLVELVQLLCPLIRVVVEESAERVVHQHDPVLSQEPCQRQLVILDVGLLVRVYEDDVKLLSVGRRHLFHLLDGVTDDQLYLVTEAGGVESLLSDLGDVLIILQSDDNTVLRKSLSQRKCGHSCEGSNIEASPCCL